MPKLLFLLVLSLALSACSTFSAVGDAFTAPLRWVGLTDKPAEIDRKALLHHTRILASDRFEGRLPGTLGEDLTVSYLTEQFQAMGLAPGNPDGSYTQDVPLVGIRAQADVGIQVRGKPLPVRLQHDVVAVSQRLDPLVRVRQSPIVFVGYGVQAPEYRWDDFKGRDLRGKTLLMLVNDPAVPDPADPAQLDPAMFKGRAMTYYGRWTYKYEMASALGAAAVLVIHETEPAGYPWAVVAGSWGTENFTLDAPDGNRDRVAVEGWLHAAKADELFAASGLDFPALKKAATRPDFEPVALPAQASFQVRNQLRRVASKNVVARVPGTRRPEELVVYTAHWDHLGKNEELEGDQIYNGALDNATGTAGLLELAEVFAARPAARSMLFLAVTAEEQGLLGARYYAENPLYPLHRTVANINMDGLNTWGRTRDVLIVGEGQNSLEDRLAEAAAAQDRIVRPEAEPEKGYYYRSDHFEFAKRGVPALYAGRGTQYHDRPPDYGMAKRKEYVTRHYHKVSDEVDPAWDLSGAVEDLQLLEMVGRAVAEADGVPQWKPGSEFEGVNRRRHP